MHSWIRTERQAGESQQWFSDAMKATWGLGEAWLPFYMLFSASAPLLNAVLPRCGVATAMQARGMLHNQRDWLVTTRVTNRRQGSSASSMSSSRPGLMSTYPMSVQLHLYVPLQNETSASSSHFAVPACSNVGMTREPLLWTLLCGAVVYWVLRCILNSRVPSRENPSQAPRSQYGFVPVREAIHSMHGGTESVVVELPRLSSAL